GWSGVPLIMSLRPLLLLALVVAAALGDAVEYGEGGRRKAKREDLPRQYPIDGNETRSLHFDYTFLSETVMYDVLDNKLDAPSIFINASLTFDILHHGAGDVLAVWRLNECFSNNCGSPLDVWVDFRRGGNNINGVYLDKDDVSDDFQPRWNFLYAIAHTIYTPAEFGEGDEQYAKTPYGMCNLLFTRPDDKRFRRQIDKCDLAGSTNVTRVDGLLFTRYKQDVHYLQNVKVDADIVIIETVEELALASPFDPNFGITVETRSHMEMTNRTFRVIERLCEIGYDADKCAVDIGLRKVGDRLYEQVDMKREVEQKYQEAQFASALSTLRGVHSDDKAWTEDHAAGFGALLIAAKKIEGAAAIGKALMDGDNYDIRSTLATALGALGGAEAVKTAREVIYGEESGLTRFGSQFLFGLAHHTHAPSDKFLKEIMYWLRDTPSSSPLHWEIANTVATVLHRDCDRSVSARNACDKGKRPILEKFVSEMTAREEVEKVLEVLVNLPNPATVSFASSHLCSSSPSIQLRAVQLIDRAPTSLYSTELTYALLRVFRNTCPSPSSTTASMTALNAMIKSIPDSQTAGTLILRTESLDSPLDQELWAYLYDAVTVSRQFDATKDSFWSKLRSFRVFRPNYAQRSLNADSNSFGADIAEFSSFAGRLRSSSEFSKGVFRGSNIVMSAVKTGGAKLAPEWPLFELQLVSTGLESYVESDHPISDVTNPKASLRLSLLSHSLPAFTVFDGHQAMMSAAMSANGQTIRVFESAVPLRTFSTVYPLLSGLSVSLDATAVAAVRLFGSSEISLWNRDSISEIHVNSSTALTASASLILEGENAQRLDSKLSLITGVQSRTEAKFAAKPYRFCVNMGNDASVISVSTLRIDDEHTKEPKTQTTRSIRSLPGHSWALGEAMRKQCRAYHQNL
ncbi:hypothetical protein PENTCL1PPCAC_18677, partial [Pristionchus entomophagus]